MEKTVAHLPGGMQCDASIAKRIGACPISVLLRAAPRVGFRQTRCADNHTSSPERSGSPHMHGDPQLSEHNREE
jgi:hypothetical protein